MKTAHPTTTAPTIDLATALSLALALCLVSPVLGAAIAAPPDVGSPPADAEVTTSGLASKVLEEGEGEASPGPADYVLVHYTGWTADGEMFDSSVARDTPVRLALDTVIDGWTEGLQLMVEGEKRRLWIPAELAYAGRDDRPQGMLVFDVELLEVTRTPEVPANVAAPPEDAERIRHGLYSVVLEPGTGETSPRRKDEVVVHYTGWTTDGQMFDTTAVRGEPATLEVNGVIEGWTHALQEMVEGEKRRLWIDEELAYRGQEGLPQGMLVFDIELLEIR